MRIPILGEGVMMVLMQLKGALAKSGVVVVGKADKEVGRGGA